MQAELWTRKWGDWVQFVGCALGGLGRQEIIGEGFCLEAPVPGRPQGMQAELGAGK